MNIHRTERKHPRESICVVINETDYGIRPRPAPVGGMMLRIYLTLILPQFPHQLRGDRRIMMSNKLHNPCNKCGTFPGPIV